MSNSSPLIPQGSLLEEQAKGRPHLRIALCIVAVHMVFLGGLLMQGCKREETPETARVVLPPLDPSTNFPGLPPFEDPTNTVEPPFGIETPPFGGAGQPRIGSNTFPSFPSQPEPTGGFPPSLSEPEPLPEPRGTAEYTVQKGDSFFAIARNFNVTAADIARANPGVDSTRLQIGQVLKIPAAGSAAVASSIPEGAPGTQPSGTGLYTVKRGDTLTRIAAQHGTTVPALKAMNGLVTDLIIINQKLKVPAASGGSTPGN